MVSKKYRIAFVIGTRAELIKSFPVMLELQKNKIDYFFIHTGQHSLGEFCELFGVKKPDVILSEEPKKSSKFNANQRKAIFWNLTMIFKIKNELKKIPGLEYVIYHGDTMTTASAAIASSKLLNPFKKYKNVHLEGGLRSENLMEPFPEEISRKIADLFSDKILAVSERACKNVEHYKRKSVCLTGNSIVDSAEYALNIAKKRKIASLTKEKFALITIHRHENLKNKERLEKITEIITSLRIPSFFAIHDNSIEKFKEFGLLDRIKQNKNIKLIKPLDYVKFIYQISKCSLIVCDGGSMQEESLIFKKPCIILRKSTERQEGLETNFQFLSKLEVEKTKEKIKEYLSQNFKIKKFTNPYGGARVSKKIINELR